MKVLIFADSHGYNMAMAFAVDREEPDAVIHLGDHAEDAREIERVFPAMPICRVRGNNDFDPEVPLNAVVTPGGVRDINPPAARCHTRIQRHFGSKLVVAPPTADRHSREHTHALPGILGVTD